MQHELDAVGADYVITESGGWTVNGPAGPKVVVTVGEKGAAWRRLRVHGTPAHGSMPFGADNALVKAAEVVRRIATYRPAAEINDVWRAYAASLDLDAETRAALVDPARVWEACESIADARTAKFAHACTHTTFSPDVVHGGTKTNVIPDEVVLEVDIRTLPGQTGDDVDRMLADALGPLAADVTVEPLHDRPSTQSATDTPLWHAIEGLVAKVQPGGHAAAAHHRRRHRRHVLPRRRQRRLRLRAPVAAPSPTRTSRAASTATTSASTSSRSGSRRSAGSTCARTFLG